MALKGMIQASSANYTPGRTHGIDYIVIHFTATTASAYNNAVYFSRPGAGASAHYFIDKNGDCWQSVSEGDTAWHAGDWDMNTRSIGIENVSAGEDFTGEQIAYLAALVQDLMSRYGIPASRVIRHYDVTGKRCPAPYIDAAKWAELHAAITGAAEAPSGGSNGGAPSIERVPVHYVMRKLGGGWLAEVTDFNNSDSEGFAGEPFCAHDLVYAYADRGTLRYRVKTREDGWLPCVSKGDPSDTVNGCAGYPGHAITGFEFYYTTPDGEEYKQAWYRSQTTRREGWLPVCCDDGTSVPGFDAWAGMDGEPADRLQLAIASANPF